MTTTPTSKTTTAEVILTFTDRPQAFILIDFPCQDDGSLDEATALLTLLASLDDDERSELTKVSLCFLSIEDDAEARARFPWMFCRDSLLFNGKLYLKQHLFED